MDGYIFAGILATFTFLCTNSTVFAFTPVACSNWRHKVHVFVAQSVKLQKEHAVPPRSTLGSHTHGNEQYKE